MVHVPQCRSSSPPFDTTLTRAPALVNGFFGSGGNAEIGRLSAICQHDDFLWCAVPVHDGHFVAVAIGALAPIPLTRIVPISQSNNGRETQVVRSHFELCLYPNVDESK